MELQRDGLVLLKSAFQEFRGKAVQPHCFRVCHCLHRCGKLLFRGLRALTSRCYGSLFGMSRSSMLGLAFSSKRRNRTHLSRIRPLSRSSLPHSLRTHCDSTFFISSSCTDVMFWNNPCWSPMRNCFSNSTTWRSTKRTTAALHTLFSQLHAFLTALRSCASLVSVFRRCHAACIVSVAS